MTTINPLTATASTIGHLLQKLNDSDPDFRFMSLNDLLTVLTHGRADILINDYNTASRTVDYLVRALDDQNGEVQNLAIKCLGPLVNRVSMSNVASLMEKLAALRLKNAVDNTVPAMSLKAVVVALPSPVPGEAIQKDVYDAYTTINRTLIPRFIGMSAAAKIAAASGGSSSHHQRQAAAAAAAAASDPSVPKSILDITASPTAESVDVLIEVMRCFGPMLPAVEVEALQDAVVSVLRNPRANTAAKKRAVVAVSILAVYLPDDAVAAFMARTAQVLRQSDMATQRLYIAILGSMARSIPTRFGRHIDEVVPFILGALGQAELDKQLEAVGEGNDSAEFNDMRESALVALDAFLASCPNQMRPYTDDAIQACLRYIKYDPNYVGDDDDDMDDDDASDDGFGDDDDEFDADAGFDDDEDASWKVRRCAAKAMHTLISTRSSGDLLDNGVLYRDTAPQLIKRFDEREETVRLEVIAAVALLVRKTGEGVLLPSFGLDDLDAASGDASGARMPTSRKRRRQSSVTGSGGDGDGRSRRSGSSGSGGGGPMSPTLERRLSIPTSGPRADLAEQTRAIVAAATKIIKGKQIPTKQAVINLLDDIVTVQRGGLADYFEQILDLVLDTVKSPVASVSSSLLSTSGGNASATPTMLRIAALRLVGHITNTHVAPVLQPYLPRIVDAVLSVIADPFYKLSSEAVATAEEVVKSMTPPRSRPSVAAKYRAELLRLYDVLMSRATELNVDTEVRHNAIRALGTLLSRTGGEGAALLPLDKRSAALAALLELLGNETSRLAAVRALDGVAAAAAASATPPFDGPWVRDVAVLLAAQLGKANNALRGASIQTLRHLVQSPAAAGALDAATVTQLVAALHPVIARRDQRLLGATLRILRKLAETQPELVATPETVAALCALLPSSAAASVLDPLLQLVTVIGSSGHGQPLMQGLLRDVGIRGDPAIVGKVIGTLLVASGTSAGVTIDNFIQEAKTAKAIDPSRSSLALAVLGEAGLRLGAGGASGGGNGAAAITPALFLEQFASESDAVAHAAAVALGRAGAGNIARYMPVILQGLAMAREKTSSAGNDGSSGNNTRYLLLQSVKEVLQQQQQQQQQRSSTMDEHMDIRPYTATLWQELLAAAAVENNKAVCAECLGRLAITAPQTYLPQLQALLGDESATLRAIAVQAIRYALPDTGEAFDAVLREYLVGMLTTALRDSDLEIQRLAMTALNSAANHKAELIQGHLGEILPYVLEASKPKPELVREVMMGPFKHLVDDGLEVRKGAYETLYALMDTALARISIISLYDRVVDGLGDDHDIRAMCNLMVSRLAYLAPEETLRRINAIADKFRATLSTKLKDNAVKQEHEKQEDANKSVLRATLLLAERLKVAMSEGTVATSIGAEIGTFRAWSQYWEWVNKMFETQMRVLRDENRELVTGMMIAGV